MKSIYKKTHLCATAGIGPNLLLAKISMDIEAKHNKDFIAEWTYSDVETKLWNITPLSKMWGIGTRMERNLNNIGIFIFNMNVEQKVIKQSAKISQNCLYKDFVMCNPSSNSASTSSGSI